MTLFNDGILYASKPFDEDAASAVFAVLDGCDNDDVSIEGDRLEFRDFLSGSLEMLIDDLVDRLGEMGISLRGRIDFFGDYEGAYLWEYGEKHEEKTQAEIAIMDAGDQELVAELKRRGYQVELWHEPAPEIKGMEMI